MSGWTACLALYGWRVLTAQAAILVAKTPLGGRVSSWDWLRSHAGLDDGTAFLITLTVAASSEVIHRSGGEGVGTWNRPTCCEHGTDLPENWSEEVFPRSRARALCLGATRLGGY